MAKMNLNRLRSLFTGRSFLRRRKNVKNKYSGEKLRFAQLFLFKPAFRIMSQ
jgi:hypothetical protein